MKQNKPRRNKLIYKTIYVLESTLPKNSSEADSDIDIQSVFAHKECINDATNNGANNGMNNVMNDTDSMNSAMNDTDSMNSAMNDANSMNSADSINDADSMNSAINNADSMNSAMSSTHDYVLISDELDEDRNRDVFDNWSSVDIFINQYCLERGFGYQIFHNDKDPDNPSVTYRKSYRCLASGEYQTKKNLEQNLHRLRGNMKTNCEWHCNFTFPKTTKQILCTTLKDNHNHELNSSQIADIIPRYRRLNDEMVQEIKFFATCKVAPITQLEILKKKYPNSVFHKQDVYNTIYKNFQDANWKVFVRHTSNERCLSGVFWIAPSQQELYKRFYDVVLNNNICKTNKYNMYLSVFMIKDNYGRFQNVANALVEDKMASMYKWILQCLLKANDDLAPKSFWTDFEPGLISAISQFNAGIQSTQSIESFNCIIKKALNSASTLCDIKTIINKRHEDESQYCKLVDIKDQYMTIGLLHVSSQFFSSVDAIPDSDTVNDNFIEDVLDKPQMILQSLLNSMEGLNIVETWRIRHIGRLSHKENLLDLNIKNSPIFTAIKPPTNCSFQVTFNFQSLHNFSQFDDYLYNEINHKRIPQRNQYRIAFFAAKTAINIALETNKDAKLVQILKEFIIANQKKHKDNMEETKNNLGIENNNLIQDAREVIPLQQHLIDQLTNPNVTKIRGAPCKKIIKSITKISKGKKNNE
ncbi:20302_t:CDS:2 [Gigaspora margarita]|uniref:20302_t:CDS:1 n=1 Tax=Gigaspora margarita TaxID=4874 RepID=A0ABN7VLB8_GIGMA|nr:20302_t:CDS:2 [Gigaspora margarita]